MDTDKNDTGFTTAKKKHKNTPFSRGYPPVDFVSPTRALCSAWDGVPGTVILFYGIVFFSCFRFNFICRGTERTCKYWRKNG